MLANKDEKLQKDLSCLSCILYCPSIRTIRKEYDLFFDQGLWIIYKGLIRNKNGAFYNKKNPPINRA